MLYVADVFYTPIGSMNNPNSRKSRSFGTAKKLAWVQCNAALQITGGMNTFANDMLNAHADLKPMHLLLNSVCYRAALRLATLSKSHPLHSHVNAAAYCGVKRHCLPLHLLMQIFQIKPRTIEKIEPIRHSPKWMRCFTTHIAANNNMAKEEEVDNNVDVQVYSDGSGIDHRVGVSAVLYRQGGLKRSLRYHLGSATHHTVYEVELVGALLETELLCTESGRWHSMIGINSQAAIL